MNKIKELETYYEVNDWTGEYHQRENCEITSD